MIGKRTRAQDGEKKLTQVSIFISIATYAVAIGTLFDAKSHAKLVEAFGAEPFGLPVTLVLASAETILYLPMPWVFWHVTRIVHQAMQDGRRIGTYSLLPYLFTVGSRHPGLRRSQMVCFGGLVYFVLIVGGWIAYTASLGI